MISEEQLDAFIKLYHQEYGITLERRQAFDSASKLLELMYILYGDRMRKELLKKGGSM